VRGAVENGDAPYIPWSAAFIAIIEIGVQVSVISRIIACAYRTRNLRGISSRF
jgi:hypothetical protein